MEMEDVSVGGWLKLVAMGDKATGIFIKSFVKPATESFGEQICVTLLTESGEQSVGLPWKNPRYVNSVKALKPGHQVEITLEGFYNQDKSELVSEPGKTKKGISFAKNYSIRQSKLPDPSYNAMETVGADAAGEVF